MLALFLRKGIANYTSMVYSLIIKYTMKEVHTMYVRSNTTQAEIKAEIDKLEEELGKTPFELKFERQCILEELEYLWGFVEVETW